MSHNEFVARWRERQRIVALLSRYRNTPMPTIDDLQREILEIPSPSESEGPK